jgi:hypothetical protein
MSIDFGVSAKPPVYEKEIRLCRENRFSFSPKGPHSATKLMNSFARSVLPFCLVGGMSLTGCLETENVVIIEPTGPYASIDTQASLAALEAIEKKQKAAIGQIRNNPGSYQPPVLYALADYLFRAGEKDEAMYFFYLGQLRARSDANKSLDPSAAAGVDQLNEAVGPPINTHAFQDIPRLKEVVERVVSDDAKLPRDYDPRWIALHGADAYLGAPLRFQSSSEWSATNTKTRQNYLREFRELVAGM